MLSRHIGQQQYSSFFPSPYLASFFLSGETHMSANYCLKAGPQLSSQWSFPGIISYHFSNLSGVGVLLQRYVDEYDALPLILPVTMSLSGNVGCIFASRLSTEFHAKTSKTSDLASMTSRDNIIVMATLFTISMPIFLAFLGVIYFLGIFKFSALFMITFLITGALSVLSFLCVANKDFGIIDIGVCYFKGMLEKRV
jgi:hypothetical protein